MSETQGISNKEKNFFSERTFEINGETLTLFFPEPGLKISKEKKQSISRRNWENIVLNLHKRVVEGIDKESAHDTKVFSGDEPNLDQIKEEVNRVLKSLKTQITPQDEEFLRYLEKSFRAKIKYLERLRNLEEVCASNSGWFEFVDALKGKAYHDLSLNFVQNFTTPVILDLKATIRDQVNKLVDSEAGDYDRELAVVMAESKILDVLTNYIIRESRENVLRLIRENKGGLRNLIITALKNQKKGMEEVNNLDEVVNRFILQIAPYLKNKSGNIIRLPTEETDSRKLTESGLLRRIQGLFNGDRLKKFRNRALNAITSGILVMAMTGSSIASFQESQQKVETPPPVLIEEDYPPIIPVSPDLQIALSNLDPEVERSYPELNKDDLGNTQKEETPKIPPEEIDSRNTLEVLAQTPTEEMPNNDKKQDKETKEQKPTFFEEKIDMFDQQCLALFPYDINKDEVSDVMIIDYPKNGDLTPLCRGLMGLGNQNESLEQAEKNLLVNGNQKNTSTSVEKQFIEFSTNSGPDKLSGKRELKFRPLTPQEKELFRIVDRANPLEPDYVPKLVRLRDYGIPTTNESIKVAVEVLEPLKKLIEAANKAGVYDIIVGSGYRSYRTQEIIYNRANDKRWVALPGASQHQTGRAIDFTCAAIGFKIDSRAGFEKTPAYLFLIENAHKYGFVMTYRKDIGHDGVPKETWHFYYVGEELAQAYYELIQNGWEGDIFDILYQINNLGAIPIDHQGNIFFPLNIFEK